LESKQAKRVAMGNYSQFSPTKKPSEHFKAAKTKSQKHLTLSQPGNQTLDSSNKSGAGLPPKRPVRLNKVKTQQNLRPSTATSQMSQNWSTSRLNIIEQTNPSHSQEDLVAQRASSKHQPASRTAKQHAAAKPGTATAP